MGWMVDCQQHARYFCHAKEIDTSWLYTFKTIAFLNLSTHFPNTTEEFLQQPGAH